MSEMIRVLSICHEDPEWILGGMGMHCRELFRHMAMRHDVKVDFLTSGPGEGSKKYLGFIKHQSSKHVCFKPAEPNMSSLLAADIQMAKTLCKLLARGYKWDIVHIHEWTSVQLGRMVKEALQIPLVGHMHLCITKLEQVEHPDWASHVADWDEQDHYLRQQEGNLVCDPDELIMSSKAYAKLVKDVFLLERRVNVIPNGVDTETWNPESGDGRRAEGVHALPTDRPVALYVGRIATMKGIVPLLDAVEAEDLGWCVVLAGEVNANTPAEKEAWEVTKRIRRLEETCPERLRWVGFRHGQELRDLYAAASCVIMPSLHEPFGIVALEAMAMGTPLVCSEVDGLGEIVVAEDNEYAMIIPPTADGIAAGLKAVRPLEVQRELRELGLRRVKEFSWHDAARRVVDVYHKALRAPKYSLGEKPCSK